MKMDFYSEPSTLSEALARAARDFAHKGVYLFDSRGRKVARHGYGDIYAGACRNAARFAAMGVELREPVLVSLPTSREWMETWFGVLLRGAWPVAMAAPGAMAVSEVHFDKMARIVANLGIRYIVAGEGFRKQVDGLGFSWTGPEPVTPRGLAEVTPHPGFLVEDPDPEDIAFLQLTSGSTGLSRAVMITHRAAIHNPLANTEAIGTPHGGPVQTWADAMVCWLPLYHDMGLLGCLMLPILTGLDTWLFRPETFLARPKLWLEQLGRHGTVFVPAPNFAYQLCVERIRPKDMEGIDLSSWRAALVGAEMVRAETMAAFFRKFEPYGFPAEALRPCYGLAEATLAVTFDQKGEGVRTLPAPAGTDAGMGLKDVVCNGEPIRDTEVIIVAPDGTTLGEGVTGAVRVKGPGIFAGYYNDPEATSRVLVDGWLTTGDLGFLQDGELYLTGRTKDVLIIRGQNLMPDDLERLADSVTGGGGLLRTAAFSVSHGTEGEEPVLVIEAEERDPEKLAAMDHEIRVRIGRALSLTLADLVFVRRGRIPRTSSGKMQRMLLRQRYLEGKLERLDAKP